LDWLIAKIQISFNRKVPLEIRKEPLDLKIKNKYNYYNNGGVEKRGSGGD